jgi:hypothetical protein
LRERMATIREEVEQRKEKYRLYPYQFKEANIVKQNATITRFVDPNTFLVAEYPNVPIRLAGVRLTSGRPISDYLQVGQKITIGINEDEESRIHDDVLQTMHAVVYSGRQNINRMLIERGFGREINETSPVGIHARFTEDEIRRGANWEDFAHKNIPIFSNKLLNVNSPLEYYERQLVYGKEWSSWAHPWRDYIQPTFESAIHQNPLVAAGVMSITGGIIGKLIGGTWRRAAWGAGIAGAIGAVGSIFRIAGEIDSGETWIPERRKKEREIDEYFDVLKYMKFRGLYEYARKKAYEEEGIDINAFLGDPEREGNIRSRRIRQLEEAKRALMLESKVERKETIKRINEELRSLRNYKEYFSMSPWALEAIRYREQMESTLYGGDPYGDYQSFYRALPSKDREFVQYFVNETNEKRRRKILSLVPENQRRYYQAHWGMKVGKKESLGDYFENHYLPGVNWPGWQENVSLSAIKLNVVKNEALDMSEFNMWPRDEIEAQYAPTIPDINRPSVNPLTISSRIRDILQGRGLRNVQVHFMEVPGGGIDIDFEYERDRTEEIQNYMINNFASLMG